MNTVRLQVDDHVATVTLDLPPVNAQSREMIDELTATMDSLSERTDVRAVVLTGAGRIFCAGADMKARQKLAAAAEPGAAVAHFRRARESFHSIVECTKPVIAAVNGPALGAGLALVASCDIIVCSPEARLGLPEIDVGLMGGARHAMRLLGHSKVRRMLLTGERIGGEELYRLGVAESCVPLERLLDEARAIAATIARKSPAAVLLAKQALNAIEEMSLRDGYRYEQTITAQLTKTADSREAMRAFIEKREPVFAQP